MKKLLRLMIPKSIRNEIKNYFLHLINTNGALSQINAIEVSNQNIKKKINSQNVLLSSHLPDILIKNDEVENKLKSFKEQYKISDKLNTNISKNDVMFHYSLFHLENMSNSYYDYLMNGLNAFNLVNKLIEHKFGNISNINSFLDFASGYGRLCRFLVLKLDPKKVWVSDIKTKSIVFQQKEFGVNGVESSFNPNDFKPKQKFDFIYVGSLFTHLPDDVFYQWLQTLYNLLTDKGVLAFTIHDVSLFNGEIPEGFLYSSTSEDAMFTEIDDSLKDSEPYGVCYASEQYVQNQILKLGLKKQNYLRYKKALANLQDLYVVTKERDAFDNSLDFTNFP
ncbi:MAG: class I SAM-dependent methyltransferase [Bacteroidota bacterium]|nr:class I SAM-dependent methyltransferase [Bacteroidota bacterium]